MSEDYKEKKKTAAAGGPEDVLDQEKFAALLKRFDEEKLQDLLGKAGVADIAEEKASTEPVKAGEPAKTENPPQPVKTEASPEPEKVEEPAEPVKANEPSKEEATAEPVKTDEPKKEDATAEPVKAEEPAKEEAAAEPVKAEEASKEEAAAEPVKAEEPAEKEKAPRKKFRPSKRLLLIAVLAGLILVPVALNQIAMNVTLNSDDPIQYSEHVDEVSASKGSLIVNDVTVAVPSDGSEEYSISYAWSEEDEEYPSVPHAITAVYSDKDGNKTHSISLYRSETVRKDEIESGKTVSNWFDDWKTVSEGKVRQQPMKSGSISGFYIYPEDASADYNDYSYYFAVQDAEGISTYVIEGILIEDEADVDLSKIMDSCIKSIRIKKPDTEQA